MRGSIITYKDGVNTMHVGHAPAGVSTAVTIMELILLVLLGIWAYSEFPANSSRTLFFIGTYFFAALLYFNAGVWLHEQLHCLPFHNPAYQERCKITYERKFLFFMHGYYKISGTLPYLVTKRALLGPLWLVAALLGLGLVGFFFLPGWWLPIMLSMALVSLCDMIHDLYWLWATRKIRDRGIYQDNGGELIVIWKGT